jgi:hypothetical protein
MGVGRRRWWVATLLGVLFLSACTENAQLFSSLDEPTEPFLATVASGSVVAGDEYLEIQIDYPDDEASRATLMVVELRDPAGVTHGRVEFDRDQLSEPTLPPVRLPDPADGVYTLVVEAWINEQVLFSEQRQIFVLAEPPRLESLTIHPTSIHTEMQALALAEITTPVGTAPYLRWLFDGNEVLQGYLSDGYDRVILDGGERIAGAYNVSLEVYPWGPDEGTVIDGSTVLTAESDVYVHAELSPTPPETPGLRFGEIVRHFSFDGTHRGWVADSDAVAATTGVSAEISGEAYLDMVAGALGLRIGPDATVAVPLGSPPGDGVAYIVSFSVSPSMSGGTLAESGVWIGDYELPVDIGGADFLRSDLPRSENEQLVTVDLLIEEGATGAEVRQLLTDRLGPPASFRFPGDEPVLTFVGRAGDGLFVDEVSIAAVDAQEVRNSLFAGALEQLQLLIGDDGAVTVAWPTGWSDPDAVSAAEVDAPGVFSDSVVVGGTGASIAWYRGTAEEEATSGARPLPEFRLRAGTDQFELVDRFDAVVDAVPVRTGVDGRSSLQTWRIRWSDGDDVADDAAAGSSPDDPATADTGADEVSSSGARLDLVLDENEIPVIIVALPLTGDRTWTIAPDATEADFPVLLGGAVP